MPCPPSARAGVAVDTGASRHCPPPPGPERHAAPPISFSLRGTCGAPCTAYGGADTYVNQVNQAGGPTCTLTLTNPTSTPGGSFATPNRFGCTANGAWVQPPLPPLGTAAAARAANSGGSCCLPAKPRAQRKPPQACARSLCARQHQLAGNVAVGVHMARPTRPVHAYMILAHTGRARRAAACMQAW